MANIKVKCITEVTVDGDVCFTEGKVYEVNNYPMMWVVVNDLGEDHHISVCTDKTKGWFSDHFQEL